MPNKSVDWVRVAAEFIVGHLSLRELAQRHGVTYASLRKRAYRENWGRERRAHSQRVAAEVTTKTVAARVDQIHAWNQTDLKLATALRSKLARRLLKIADNVEDPRDGLLELRLMAAACESVQRAARLALGAPTEHMGISRHQADPNGPTLRDWYQTIEELEVDDADGDAGGDPSQNVSKGGR